MDEHRLRRLTRQCPLGSLQRELSFEILNGIEQNNNDQNTPGESQSVGITSADLNLKSGERITDIQLKDIGNIYQTYGNCFESLTFEKTVGDEIVGYDDTVVSVSGWNGKRAISELCSDLSDAYYSDLVGDGFGIKPQRQNNALEEYISQLENQSKKAISEHNPARLSFLMEEYRHLIEICSINSELYSSETVSVELPTQTLQQSLENTVQFTIDVTSPEGELTPSKRSILGIIVYAVYRSGAESYKEGHDPSYSEKAEEVLDRFLMLLPRDDVDLYDDIRERRDSLRKLSGEESKENRS
ncbi:hypothetical protein [Halogeometricum pallidum]|uniref:hypothetical protein n=1 Tax=Halogeometricum pallidum TaxID=411361 RepID=UPI001267CEA2|nr:hypothetical protein [Halogeometricum pallidum]